MYELNILSRFVSVSFRIFKDIAFEERGETIVIKRQNEIQVACNSLNKGSFARVLSRTRYRR